MFDIIASFLPLIIIIGLLLFGVKLFRRRGTPSVSGPTMMQEKKPRKISSVILLLIGGIFIMGALLPSCSHMLLLGRDPELGITIFMTIAGAGFIWAGIVRWQRWPMSLGVISVIFGVLNLANVPIVKSVAEKKTGIEAEYLLAMSKAAVRIAIGCMIIGIALIFYQTLRNKKERASQHSPNSGQKK